MYIRYRHLNEQCSDPDSFKQDVLADFDEGAINSVMYQQWVPTNKTTLETIVKGVEEFCDTLTDKFSSFQEA